MKIYTRKGDDGTTGLYYGGRVRKDDPAPMAYGDVDEAQAAIGLARSEVRLMNDDESMVRFDDLLISIERDLWVLMADLATDDGNRAKLVEGMSRVNNAMIERLEQLIDEYSARFELPKEFVVPGQNRLSALLDVARTVTRRAERSSLAAVAEDSLVLTYLNRLSDLLWTLARFAEHGASVTARS